MMMMLLLGLVIMARMLDGRYRLGRSSNGRSLSHRMLILM